MTYLPRKRTVLKMLHIGMPPLAIWFTFVQPSDVARWGLWYVELHSVFGLLFVSLALLWSALYLRHGLVGRPGPKLGGWARHMHRALHHALVWGLFLVALTGFLLGLTASRQLWAGGIVPIAMPLGLPDANALVGIVHAVEFYLLAGLIAAHAGFHLWRHLWLRDNALRIMAPRWLHRFL